MKNELNFQRKFFDSFEVSLSFHSTIDEVIVNAAALTSDDEDDESDDDDDDDSTEGSADNMLAF